MQSTASLHPFASLDVRHRRRAEYRRAAPECWSVLSRDQAPEPRVPVWQTCLLAGGSSLALWGLIGSIAWHFLG